jgi:hypothetical protein
MQTIVRSTALVALACAAAALLGPSSAAGAVRHGAVDDPPAQRTPAFDNANVRYEPDVMRVEVAYDEAGTVRASVSFYDPPGTSATSPNFNVALELADCTSDEDDTPTLRISFDRGIYNGNIIERAFATRSDALGSLQAQPTVSADGRTFTVEFTHALLAGQNYTCVRPALRQAPPFSPFYFAGFEPPRPAPIPPPARTPTPPRAEMTASAATQAADAYLAARYGERWTTGTRKWLRCPEEEIFPEGLDDDSPAALCEFEVSFGQVFRGGRFLVTLTDNQFSVPSRTFSTSTYSKTRRRCSRLSATRGGYVNGVRLTGRRLRASGFLGCRYLPGGAGMVGDIDAMAAARWPRPFPATVTVGLHGTNRAGFEDRARFPCRVTRRGRREAQRYVFDCANKLGDGFQYAFTVRAPRR